ncbi:hypothetical protein DB42_BN00660 [Neochlamydia sp. EPS4]|uniref:hypothetical protein n=1 Tax=unclassified Neochlamydia TaxID=2643326 RepID=UPI000582A6DD|nr:MULTISPECIES: hypothetical protein [unclassified Neochlamydia]KIC74003.1 hypothetical protein DB42_BN00660 [Neochlamydia sp. EPS4]BBI16955.1 hypothetical protein NCS13_1_0760 [Neochlamydia sp. S13]
MQYAYVYRQSRANFEIFGYKFRLNLIDTLQQKLKIVVDRPVAKSLAVRTLKNIERESSIKAFLTKRVVVITATSAVVVSGLFLPHAVASLAVLTSAYVRSVIAAVGTIFIAYVMANNNLPKLSQAYQDQARQARYLMEEIRNKEDNVAFIFPNNERIS